VDNVESAIKILDIVSTDKESYLESADTLPSILTRDCNSLDIGDAFSFEMFKLQAAPAWEELKFKLWLAKYGTAYGVRSQELRDNL